MTSEPTSPITKELLDAVFARMNDLLGEERLSLDVYLFGGANMVYSYASRSRTEEVDVGAPTDLRVERIAVRVGAEFGLPANWIDTQFHRFLPPTSDAGKWTVLDLPNLRVGAASARYMLAMKLAAGRAKDWPDVELLFHELGIRSSDETLKIYREVWAGDDPPPSTIAWLASRRVP